MRIVYVLHLLSHLRWFFLFWMIGQLIFIFSDISNNTPSSVGNTIFIAGLMMGFTSLSDTSRMGKKQMEKLRSQKYVKFQFIGFFSSVAILVFVSILFFSVRFIFPSAEKTVLNDFTKLGYDCLVMLLGILCLVKQFIDQVDYVKSQVSN